MSQQPEKSAFRRVLVCGDREWSDRILVFDTLDRLWFRNPLLVITGGCRGADTLAEEWAKNVGAPCRVLKADWSLGKRAGPIRNTRMLEELPDLVLAFHDDLERSKGTKDMVGKARRAGVLVLVVSHADTGTGRTITQSTIPLEGETIVGDEKEPEDEQPDARQIAEEQAEAAAQAQEDAGGTAEQSPPPAEETEEEEEG